MDVTVTIDDVMKGYWNTMLECAQEKLVQVYPKWFLETTNYFRSPRLLLINDDERMVNNRNEMIDIEIRCNKKHNWYFFRAADVGKWIGNSKLHFKLINNKEYEYDIDYEYLKSSRYDVHEDLYFSYNGMIKLTEKYGKLDYFRDWAEKVIFKEEMIRGIDCYHLKTEINSDIEHECIYLYLLDTVSSLRDTMDIDEDIPDTYIVCKFGHTKQLSTRTKEHIRSYRIPSMVFLFAYPVKSKNKLFAERTIKSFFNKNGMIIDYGNEHVAFPCDYLTKVRKYYEKVAEKYGATTKKYSTFLETIEKIRERAIKYDNGDNVMYYPYENLYLSNECTILNIKPDAFNTTNEEQGKFLKSILKEVMYDLGIEDKSFAIRKRLNNYSETEV